MSISSQLIQRVEDAVYHNPYLIPTLFKEGNVKAGFLHSRLRRYVPHRVGIEFECFGDFANQYLMDNKKKWDNCGYFERYFKILDFSQDSLLINHKVEKRKSKEEFKRVSEEIRVSIQDYRQLNGLYNILKEMAKYCAISEDCGIHIHVDLTKYDKAESREKAVRWFNKHLDEVESIFPKYKGYYNKRIAQQGKGAWINLSSKGTVEFRIAPLTFDYEVLIVWIVKCCKLVSRMISECHLDALKPKTTNWVINNSGSLFYDLGVGSAPSWINVPGANAADFASVQDALLFSYLDQAHIDHHIEDGMLILDQLGGRSSIRYTTALRLFRAGGLSEVLRGARPIEGDTPMDLPCTEADTYCTPDELDLTTQNDQYVIVNNGTNRRYILTTSGNLLSTSNGTYSSDWYTYAY